MKCLGTEIRPGECAGCTEDDSCPECYGTGVMVRSDVYCDYISRCACEALEFLISILDKFQEEVLLLREQIRSEEMNPLLKRER